MDVSANCQLSKTGEIFFKKYMLESKLYFGKTETIFLTGDGMQKTPEDCSESKPLVSL